jgi:hypothetical protein
MHRLFSLDIAPVSRMMAQDSSGWTPGWTETRSRSYGLKEDQVQSSGWTPGWTETRSRSYGLKEDQVQMLLNQPGPG